ncbi:ribosome maturation factor RimP [bacterium]|nr:ribosome maturation factor RimP [bacterium]
MKAELRNAFSPLISDAGAHLVDVEVRQKGKKRLVEVFVDTDKGITADELAQISRSLADAVEKGDLVQDAYTLIVSSPGLERPLEHPWQFRRHTGRNVRVRWKDGDAESEFCGEVAEVTDEQLLLRDGEGFRTIPHEDILHAVVEITL